LPAWFGAFFYFFGNSFSRAPTRATPTTTKASTWKTNEKHNNTKKDLQHLSFQFGFSSPRTWEGRGTRSFVERFFLRKNTKNLGKFYF
jgi:hypothetical protein